MKFGDLNIKALVEVIGESIVPLIFAGVDEKTPAHELRERAQLNAEVMGRVAAVLYCGEQVGPDVGDLIRLFTSKMRLQHLQAMDGVLGPNGSLSRMDRGGGRSGLNIPGRRGGRESVGDF